MIARDPCSAVSTLRRSGRWRVRSTLAAGSLCVVLYLCSACGLKIIDSDEDLEYGECVQGRLRDGHDEDRYSLEMRSGETAIVVVSPSYHLATCVYEPGGGLMSPADCVHASESGTYVLGVSWPWMDYDESGEYWLYVNRASHPGPHGATVLDHGDCESAYVDSICGVAVFAFDAGAGDTVRVTMTPLSDTLIPKFAVYGPDGTWIAGAGGETLPQGEAIRADSIHLNSAGVYSVFAGGGAWGYLGEGAGDFEFCVERQPRR